MGMARPPRAKARQFEHQWIFKAGTSRMRSSSRKGTRSQRPMSSSSELLMAVTCAAHASPAQHMACTAYTRFLVRILLAPSAAMTLPGTLVAFLGHPHATAERCVQCACEGAAARDL